MVRAVDGSGPHHAGATRGSTAGSIAGSSAASRTCRAIASTLESVRLRTACLRGAGSCSVEGQWFGVTGGSASRTPTVSVDVTARKPSSVGVTEAPRPRRASSTNVGDLALVAQGPPYLGDLGGDLLGVDAVLGVLGLRLLLPLGGGLPLALQAPFSLLEPEVELQLVGVAPAQQQPLHQGLDDAVCRRARAPRRRWPCGSPRACGAGRRGRCRRSGCPCRRSVTARTCLGRWPKRSTRPSRCSWRVGFHARS